MDSLVLGRRNMPGDPGIGASQLMVKPPPNPAMARARSIVQFPSSARPGTVLSALRIEGYERGTRSSRRGHLRRRIPFLQRMLALNAGEPGRACGHMRNGTALGRTMDRRATPGGGHGGAGMALAADQGCIWPSASRGAASLGLKSSRRICRETARLTAACTELDMAEETSLGSRALTVDGNPLSAPVARRSLRR